MKTIGLLGGMSWESTVTYYQLLNRLARKRLGGLHSAEILMWSFDFATIEALQAAGDWAGATSRMIEAAQRLERGGAKCLLICTNTMHKMADEVSASIDIPLLHIADVTASAIQSDGASKPLLLATRYTMEQEFYTGRLQSHHGIDVVVPNASDRSTVHDIIYEELCQGIIRKTSKQKYVDIVNQMTEAGTDSVIFGCTEVSLLISNSDFSIPCFDTTSLHAEAAINFALN